MLVSNQNLTWELLESEWRGGFGLSHSRDVYISSQNNGFRMVAKLENWENRSRRILVKTFPHSEEIAYKISKLLQWNTIPKTKVIHQFSLQKSCKYEKYFESLSNFIKEGEPQIFTFQSFVNGKPLPNAGEKKKQKPDLDSYQRAFILDMILGKRDARGDNVIYNPNKNELFEIDNELIGETGYPTDGVLNDFADLKQKKISEKILQNLLQVNLNQLNKIRTKYEKRDVDLFSQCKENPCSFSDRWERIFSNFQIIKDMASKSAITLNDLENSLKTKAS